MSFERTEVKLLSKRDEELRMTVGDVDVLFPIIKLFDRKASLVIIVLQPTHYSCRDPSRRRTKDKINPAEADE
jgi:hypothetical protein